MLNALITMYECSCNYNYSTLFPRIALVNALKETNFVANRSNVMELKNSQKKNDCTDFHSRLFEFIS